MCCIFNLMTWLFGFLHKFVTGVFVCMIAYAICGVMLFAITAGVALGYNYSVSEYMEHKDTNVSVQLLRGIFQEKSSGDTGGRRASGGEVGSVESSNFEPQGSYNDESLGQQIRHLDAAQNYEQSLNGLTTEIVESPVANIVQYRVMDQDEKDIQFDKKELNLIKSLLNKYKNDDTDSNMASDISEQVRESIKPDDGLKSYNDDQISLIDDMAQNKFKSSDKNKNTEEDKPSGVASATLSKPPTPAHNNALNNIMKQFADEQAGVASPTLSKHPTSVHNNVLGNIMKQFPEQPADVALTTLSNLPTSEHNNALSNIMKQLNDDQPLRNWFRDSILKTINTSKSNYESDSESNSDSLSIPEARSNKINEGKIIEKYVNSANADGKIESSAEVRSSLFDSKEQIKANQILQKQKYIPSHLKNKDRKPHEREVGNIYDMQFNSSRIDEMRDNLDPKQTAFNFDVTTKSETKRLLDHEEELREEEFANLKDLNDDNIVRKSLRYSGNELTKSHARAKLFHDTKKALRPNSYNQHEELTQNKLENQPLEYEYDDEAEEKSQNYRPVRKKRSHNSIVKPHGKTETLHVNRSYQLKENSNIKLN